MNGLDLFSGIGGISLALKPWVNTVAYCEQDRYAQSVLMSRMLGGELDTAPIWDDIRTLRGNMLPKIDIIYGGFPCQDISVAGKGEGIEGERSGLYFELLRLVDECQPAYVFLENVPAIRTRGLSTVARTLADRGYDFKWKIVSAAEVGAPHLRKRWWCLASDPKRIKLREQQRWCSGESREGTTQLGQYGKSGIVADSASDRLQGLRTCGEQESPTQTTAGLSGCEGKDRRYTQWEVEPAVGRVVDGLQHRVDRIRCLGNAVVPAQAREAFLTLMGV